MAKIGEVMIRIQDRIEFSTLAFLCGVVQIFFEHAK
jgi:hypothetical protein